VQSRGYQMDIEISGSYQVDCNGGDFTFEDYMREIDSGRPVLISIEGHSMAGYGYNATTREIIFDDCYTSGQRMVWDETYYYSGADRRLQSISVIGINVNGDVDLALVETAGSKEKIILAGSSGALASADYCFAGATVYLTYTIQNIGSKESRDFYTAVRVNGDVVSSGLVYSLSAKSTRKYQNVSLGKLEVGMHNVRVTVDENNTVQELSGKNNVGEASILVLKSGTSIVSGNKTVSNWKTASDTYVQGGGTLTLNEGRAFNTILRGKITSSSSDGTVWFYNGKANVQKDGYLADTDIYDYGKATVSSGGTAVNTNIFSKGYTSVCSGGVASNTSVGSGGYLEVYSGAKLTGELRIDKGGTATVFDGGILDFNLTSVSPGAAARVNDLSRINYNNSPVYTLTIAGTQKNGNYALIENAAGFNQTISVQNTSGKSLGTLKVGQTINIGASDYSLELNDDQLSVTVSAAASPAARGDRDGNGVSDVMFVWTGNNYVHGYWMNGTSEWWSANAVSVSPDWENLGSYDMSGDGKADAVMFGNVVVNGAKGAYIGYYQNGDDASGWVTIGYLNNAENNTWKNKVGNLTGNASGANSIVWYAPDLYALGVWLDGTDSWLTLSGDFGGNEWKLAGCGDFSGSGKDSVLMAYNGGQLFYAVDIAGTPTALGGANWSGWEVRAIADFAGDGKDDIVLFHKESGSMVMLTNGNADNFNSIGQLDPMDWFIAGAGDYNGDGKDDLLVRQYSTGMLGYYNSGDTSKWVELGRGVDMNWTVIA
jgi:autotransporter passenger strand-loop-strand repeat protein